MSTKEKNFMPKGQILFYEDFTPKNTLPPALPTGWTSIETPEAKGHWIVYEIQGSYFLYCQETELWSLEYDPVKTEYALTPPITLPADELYGVNFLWIAQSIGILDKGAYEFKVGVTEDDGATWDILWSASNREEVEQSGVVFPWANWSRNSSTVSLQKYQGKTIRIGFIYHLADPQNGNLVRIAEVSVLPYIPVEGPVVAGSENYHFGDVYLNIKQKGGEPLFLANAGIGELQVLAIEGLAGTGFSTDLLPGSVSLTPQASVDYNVYYTPTAEGPDSATMIIKTNGGDLTVELTGNKIILPEGYTVESFEGATYPPVGWTLNIPDTWKLSNLNPRSGEMAVEAFWINLATLTTPALDLSAGNHQVIFDYAAGFDEEELYTPENLFYLELSTDGGTSWNTIWTAPTPTSSPYTRITAPLNNIASGNCLLRWVYYIEKQVSYDTICSTIYLDNIVLPPFVGTGQKPAPVTNPQPADGSTGQSASDLTLSWKGSLLADHYKLYVGTDADDPVSVLNGQLIDKNAPTAWQLGGLEYETTYYWKVVAGNSTGESEDNPTWSFTTGADQAISSFPYNYGFEDGLMPPTGWQMYGENNCRWTNFRDPFNAYEGDYSALVTLYGQTGNASLQMPEIRVPADRDLQISFVWGNAVPANLTRGKDVYFDNGYDAIYFQIKVPGEDWKELAVCSQPSDNKVWEKKRILLRGYRGKVISLRWQYDGIFAVSSKGASLDAIELSYASEQGTPTITYSDWYAGKYQLLNEWKAGVVNYKQVISSGDVFILANEGEQPLEIQSISFSTPFFATTLTPGLNINANQEIRFGITFSGVEARKEIRDTLVVEFTDGQRATFPVEGEAVGADIRCYTFDNDKTFTTTGLAGWKTVDQDRLPTIPFVGIEFEGKGSPYAFLVMNWEKANWGNIYPRSGKQLLLASGPDSDNSILETADWLITDKKLTPLANAQLRLYAKSYGQDWGPHYLTVLISTTDDEPGSFTALPGFTNVEIPVAENYQDFTECIADLSAFEGQEIYIAILHTSRTGLAFFMDDIYLEHFRFPDPEAQPPVFLTEPPLDGMVGEEYIYNFALATSPGAGPLTITVKGRPKWMEYIPRENGGILRGIPNDDWIYFIKIEATDGTNSVYQEFEIEVVKATS